MSSLQRPPRHVLVEDKPAARDFQQTQDNTEEFTRRVSAVPLLDGRLIKDIQLTGGTAKKIAHKLGRVYVGWILTRLTAIAQDHPKDNRTNTDNDKFIELTSTSNAVIDIWIF